MRVAAAEFGLDYHSESKAIILKNLESYFKECAHLGKRALLLVDEAQNLPPRAVEELRMLSNFQMNGRSLVQSFLLGQKEFRDVMRSQDFVQLRQRVIAAYHLRPLDTAETRAYIEHRLRVVGWKKNDPLFMDEVFPLIHRITQGVPRRINLFCDRLLLFASLEDKRVIDAAVVTAVTNDLDQEDLLISDEAPEAKDGQSGQVAVLHRGTAPGTAGAKRLDAIEDSLESLGNIVRRELVMLRKAIVDTKFGDTKKAPGDEHHYRRDDPPEDLSGVAPPGAIRLQWRTGIPCPDRGRGGPRGSPLPPNRACSFPAYGSPVERVVLGIGWPSHRLAQGEKPAPAQWIFQRLARGAGHDFSREGRPRLDRRCESGRWTSCISSADRSTGLPICSAKP